MKIKYKIKRFIKKSISLIYHRYLLKKKVIGKGNKIDIKSFCAGTSIDLIGNNNSVRILNGGSIEGLKIFIRGSNISILIEENVVFGRGSASLWLEDENSSISIGKNSSFFGNVHIASTEGARISIGRDCLVAPAVQIRSGDSHAIYNKGVRTNKAKPVLISDRVWIGDGAVILKGAKIPPDSVIATRAVVTKLFHNSGSVIAGNPARLVKTGITWSIDRRMKDNNQ